MTEKKKSKVLSKKQSTEKFVRTTSFTSKQIQSLANQIWSQWEQNCRDAGYYRPSSKMAIDYMLCTASECGPFKVAPLNPKNNIYLAVEGLHKEEQ
jgi:hypothetical protein